MTDNIGTIIWSLRKDNSETQQQLADALGVSRSFVKSWENNERPIRSDDLIMLARHYGVSADYILGLSEAKSPDLDIQTAVKITGLNDAAIANLAECYQHCQAYRVEDLMSALFSNEHIYDIIAALGTLRLLLDFIDHAEAVNALEDEAAIAKGLEELKPFIREAEAMTNDKTPSKVAKQILSNIYMNARFEKYELSEMFDTIVETILPKVSTLTLRHDPFSGYSLQ